MASHTYEESQKDIGSYRQEDGAIINITQTTHFLSPRFDIPLL